MFIILIALVLFSLNSFSQDSAPTNKKNDLSLLFETDYIAPLYTLQYDSAKSFGETLLPIAKNLPNKRPYIHLLIHTYRFHGYQQAISNLSLAESIALETNNKHELPAIYKFKGFVFRDNSLLDSAIIYFLKSYDLVEELNIEDEKPHILMAIADIHYYSGAYDDAEKIYKNLLYESDLNKVTWAKRTLNNNLGLIEIIRGNYQKAERYFLTSTAIYGQNGLAIADSSGLIYSYKKLMQINIQLGDLQKAEYYFNSGVELCNILHLSNDLASFYLGKGKLLNLQNNTGEAVDWLKRAEKAEIEYPDIAVKIDIYKAFADTYSKLGNLALANKYLVDYISTHQTSDSLIN